MDAEAMMKITQVTQQLRELTERYQLEFGRLARQQESSLYLRLRNQTDWIMMRNFTWRASCMRNPTPTATSRMTLRLREAAAYCPRTVSLFKR